MTVIVASHPSKRALGLLLVGALLSLHFLLLMHHDCDQGVHQPCFSCSVMSQSVADGPPDLALPQFVALSEPFEFLSPQVQAGHAWVQPACSRGPPALS